MAVPRYDDLFHSVLQALQRLGGSASIAELDEEVTRHLGLTADSIAYPHDERQTELEYQLAWARTYLKKYGLIDNSARGIWVLTSKGQEVKTVDAQQVKRHLQSQRSRAPKPLSNYLKMDKCCWRRNQSKAQGSLSKPR